MKLFIIAPINDDITQKTTSIWAQEIADFALAQKIQVISFIGENVNKKQVLDALKLDQGEAGIFCYLDHGVEDKIFDSKGDSLLDLDNISLLENKFVYIIACLTGKTLGPAAIEAGALGFLGYKEKVKLFLRKDYPSQAGACLSTGLVGMLKNGLSAKEAAQNIAKKMRDTERNILNANEIIPDRLFIADTFRHNLDSLILYGNKDWCWEFK